MNLPSRAIQKLDICSGCVSGSARCKIGTRISSTPLVASTTVQIAGENRRVTCALRLQSRCPPCASRLRAAPFEREQSLRPALNEQDDEYEHGDLGHHRARPRLQKFR